MTEAEQPNGYIPGDIIELSFEFGHNMHVEQVAAIFTKADEPESDIILSGVPETLYEIRGGPNNVDFRSTVTLYAGIEANDPPGLYGCREVFVLTSGGQRLAFETAPDMGFWVVPEPDTPPRYTGEVRPGSSGAGA